MITIGCVHPGGLSWDLHESIERMRIVGDMHEIGVKSGPLISRARNDIVYAFVNGLPDSEHLLMVDTDIRFYPDDVEKLIKADRPIISGLYTGLQPDGQPFPVCHQRGEDGNLRRPDWSELPKSGITTVVSCGMGFCLIKREVLETFVEKRKGRKLWPFQELEIPGEQVMGEDVTFCVRAEAFGYRTYLDVDVPVGHIKSGLIMPPGYGG